MLADGYPSMALCAASPCYYNIYPKIENVSYLWQAEISKSANVPDSFLGCGVSLLKSSRIWSCGGGLREMMHQRVSNGLTGPLVCGTVVLSVGAHSHSPLTLLLPSHPLFWLNTMVRPKGHALSLGLKVYTSTVTHHHLQMLQKPVSGFWITLRLRQSHGIWLVL